MPPVYCMIRRVRGWHQELLFSHQYVVAGGRQANSFVPMRTLKSLGWCCLAGMLCVQAVKAQPALLQGDSLQRYVRRYMDSMRVPGLAVAVVHDGTVKLVEGFGWCRQGGVERVTGTTLFPIASVTKTFTGIALARAEAAGQLQLQDKVTRWVPAFRPAWEPYASELTVADVLSHRGGWKIFQGDLLNTESNLTEEELVSRLSYVQPVYALRTRFGYSNMGFLLAGQALQAATGRSWQQYVQDSVLAPAGLQQTFASLPPAGRYSTATGHLRQGADLVVSPPSIEQPRAYGGMLSSAADLASWLQLLLDSGRQGSRQVIPAAAVQKTWWSHTIIGKQMAADRRLYFKTYGLGTEIWQYGQHEVIQHGGAGSGILTCVAMVPAQRLGVVVLSNADGHALHELLKWQLLDALLGKEAPDYCEQWLARQRQRRHTANAVAPAASIPATTEPAPALVGRYYSPAYGEAEVQQQTADTWLLKLAHHPGVTGQLRYLGGHRFECRYSHPMFGKVVLPATVQGGQVRGFDLTVDPFVEDGVYRFERR